MPLKQGIYSRALCASHQEPTGLWSFSAAVPPKKTVLVLEIITFSRPEAHSVAGVGSLYGNVAL